MHRQLVRPFSEDTTRLAQMFAAQGVIAVENAHDPRHSGSGGRSGDRVGVAAQLVDGTTGGHVCLERYD